MIANDVLIPLEFVSRQIIPENYETPSEWAAKNIVFSDAKAPIKGPLDLRLSPFLVDPLNAWYMPKGKGLKEVTVCAPEQLGKTTIELAGLCYTMQKNPGLALVCYTADDKAERVNEEKFEPILRNIPEFSELLKLQFAKTVDCYRLGKNLVYFGGVGSRVSSHSARVCIADEIDDWKEARGVSALNDMRKRSRAFAESILYKVCTPMGTASTSRIWREFERSSMGYWYLCCRHCGGLTIRSADIYRMQFELDDAGEAVADSIRVVCPSCGHQHAEHDKAWMNHNGGYKHQHPERLEMSPGYQWGALASQMVSLAWPRIAEKQLAAGRTGYLPDQMYFDNSVRGMPFRARRMDDASTSALKRHCAPTPDGAKILFRFLSADTQDDCFYWVVRGIDEAFNSYLLASGRAADECELAHVWMDDYQGGKINVGIIDEGGHNAGTVRDFCAERSGVFSYKGNPRIGKKWEESKEIKTLIVANPHHYRVQLLYQIYASTNRGNNYWFLPDKISDDYREQITAWRPNPKVKSGDELENYISDGNDHYFDAEKMLLVLLDYFKDRILPLLSTYKRKTTIKRV